MDSGSFMGKLVSKLKGRGQPITRDTPPKLESQGESKATHEEADPSRPLWMRGPKFTPKAPSPATLIQRMQKRARRLRRSRLK